jgi:pilus assembly protein Flp/PilA
MEQDASMTRSQTMRRLRDFVRDDGGATAIEYALIAGGVSIAIVAAVTSVGTTMNTLYYDKLLNMF